jgi:hypothetical protein
VRYTQRKTAELAMAQEAERKAHGFDYKLLQQENEEDSAEAAERRRLEIELCEAVGKNGPLMIDGKPVVFIDD